jgi:hypothetical protein
MKNNSAIYITYPNAKQNLASHCVHVVKRTVRFVAARSGLSSKLVNKKKYPDL